MQAVAFISCQGPGHGRDGVGLQNQAPFGGSGPFCGGGSCQAIVEIQNMTFLGEESALFPRICGAERVCIQQHRKVSLQEFGKT